MSTISAQTPLSGSEAAAMRSFRSSLQGAMLVPGDAGYDHARRVFNAMIDRRPALIVRPANAEDIRHAVLFAREHDLPLSIKGGGHSIGGSAVSNCGVMIDCSSMKHVQVDSDRRIAVADPGLLLADLDRATQARGLATPLGVVSVTGIAGLTLGGGIGWLNGKYGLACDNLLAADVVTADGELVHASAAEHPDLFWALRGGSGNFGVVTSFVYRLHPVGPVLGGAIIFPGERARDVLRFYHAFASAAPDDLTTVAFFDIDNAGQTSIGISVCWCGPHDEGERARQPLRSFGSPLEDGIGIMDYVALQGGVDDAFPPNHQHYWKARWLVDVSDGAIDAMLACVARWPVTATGRTELALQQIHGAAARVAPRETAFPHRRDQYDFLILTQWTDPADADSCIAWTRETFESMAPFTERAVYVNNLGTEGEDRVREAYGAHYPRLAAIKARYDPTNLFRTNQNVRPQPL
jgi:FAD/FMN-containing dehydrogenase